MDKRVLSKETNMTTQTTSKWILVIPMNDMEVYSFACPECTNSVIKFLHDEEWKEVDPDPIKQCFVCGKEAK